MNKKSDTHGEHFHTVIPFDVPWDIAGLRRYISSLETRILVLEKEREQNPFDFDQNPVVDEMSGEEHLKDSLP